MGYTCYLGEGLWKMETVLGSEKVKFLFVCRGAPSPKEMYHIATAVITCAGMTAARKGRIERYPYRGKGGKGYTLWRPLMESYLVADVYTDLNETEILISTCKPERIDEAAWTALLGRKGLGLITVKRL